MIAGNSFVVAGVPAESAGSADLKNKE